jgi:glycosyltransferase involved in cell wall biosynthesis
MTSKISVITPVYKGMRFIESCIDNVIAQECPAIEHVIVDGGSTDGTVDVIRRYAEKFPHIRWVSKKDKGQSDAMNKGIALATGNILSSLNVDDYYEPGALNFVLGKFAALPKPSLLVGNCTVWGDDEEILWVNKPRYLELKKLLVANEKHYPFPVNPSAWFYHKSLHDIIGMYDPNNHYDMDIDFVIKAVMNSHAEYVDVALGNFRFIQGTKTFEDFRNGNGMARHWAFIDKNRKLLSPMDRMMVLLEMFALKLSDFVAWRRWAKRI